MSASPEPEIKRPAKDPITFKFCADCANLLFPQENRETHELMFACKTCQYSEKASSSCVYRNNLDTSIGETAGVTTDVGSDPTVGLPDFCTLCGSAISCSYCGDDVDGDVKMKDDKNNHNATTTSSRFEEFSEWAADDGDEEDELAAKVEQAMSKLQRD